MDHCEYNVCLRQVASAYMHCSKHKKCLVYASFFVFFCNCCVFWRRIRSRRRRRRKRRGRHRRQALLCKWCWLPCCLHLLTKLPCQCLQHVCTHLEHTLPISLHCKAVDTLLPHQLQPRPQIWWRWHLGWWRNGHVVAAAAACCTRSCTRRFLRRRSKARRMMRLMRLQWRSGIFSSAAVVWKRQ